MRFYIANGRGDEIRLLSMETKTFSLEKAQIRMLFFKRFDVHCFRSARFRALESVQYADSVVLYHSCNLARSTKARATCGAPQDSECTTWAYAQQIGNANEQWYSYTVEGVRLRSCSSCGILKCTACRSHVDHSSLHCPLSFQPQFALPTCACETD